MQFLEDFCRAVSWQPHCVMPANRERNHLDFIEKTYDANIVRALLEPCGIETDATRTWAEFMAQDCLSYLRREQVDYIPSDAEERIVAYLDKVFDLKLGIDHQKYQPRAGTEINEETPNIEPLMIYNGKFFKDAFFFAGRVFDFVRANLLIFAAKVLKKEHLHRMGFDPILVAMMKTHLKKISTRHPIQLIREIEEHYELPEDTLFKYVYDGGIGDLVDGKIRASGVLSTKSRLL